MSKSTLDIITERVANIKDEAGYAKLSEDLANELGTDTDVTDLIVDAIRLSVENDYMLVDVFYGTINKILTILKSNNLVTEEQLNYIQEETEKWQKKK